MHFACGIFEIGGFWCEIEKLIIFERFRANRARNRREVDNSGSNALVHASVDVLGVEFEKAIPPQSSQHLPAPPNTPTHPSWLSLPECFGLKRLPPAAFFSSQLTIFSKNRNFLEMFVNFATGIARTAVLMAAS